MWITICVSNFSNKVQFISNETKSIVSSVPNNSNCKCDSKVAFVHINCKWVSEGIEWAYHFSNGDYISMRLTKTNIVSYMKQFSYQIWVLDRYWSCWLYLCGCFQWLQYRQYISIFLGMGCKVMLVDSTLSITVFTFQWINQQSVEKLTSTALSLRFKRLQKPR